MSLLRVWCDENFPKFDNKKRHTRIFVWQTNHTRNLYGTNTVGICTIVDRQHRNFAFNCDACVKKIIAKKTMEKNIFNFSIAHLWQFIVLVSWQQRCMCIFKKSVQFSCRLNHASIALLHNTHFTQMVTCAHLLSIYYFSCKWYHFCLKILPFLNRNLLCCNHSVKILQMHCNSD